MFTSLKLAVAAAVLALALPAAAKAPPAPAPAAKPVQVMILGTYHFANPGRDLHNVQADDVLAPGRQAQLQALADELAAFRPTKVAVERQSAAADFTLDDYARYGAGELNGERSEVYQIGYRLAVKAGLPAVYGVDEKPGEGEPDYFPYGKVAAYAAEHGRADWLKGLHGPIQKYLAQFPALQAKLTIPELLAVANDPAVEAELHRAGYYGLLPLGDPELQPGAELNALWYMRNAKIFSKLAQVAQPGDRIVVVFGGGHAYWLRHFVENTPGFELVDPRTVLPKVEPLT